MSDISTLQLINDDREAFRRLQAGGLEPAERQTLINLRIEISRQLQERDGVQQSAGIGHREIHGDPQAIVNQLRAGGDEEQAQRVEAAIADVARRDQINAARFAEAAEPVDHRALERTRAGLPTSVELDQLRDIIAGTEPGVQRDALERRLQADVTAVSQWEQNIERQSD